MSREKKRKRRAYLDDFQKDASGKYVYVGVRYAFSGDRASRRRFLTILWILCGAMLAASVAANCLPGALFRNRPYLVLPGGLSLVASFSVIWKLCRLTVGGDPLRGYVYQETVERLPILAMLSAMCGLLSLAGGLYGAIFGGAAAEGSACFLFLALELLVLLGALGVKKLFSHLTWEKEQDL